MEIRKLPSIAVVSPVMGITVAGESGSIKSRSTPEIGFPTASTTVPLIVQFWAYRFPVVRNNQRVTEI